MELILLVEIWEECRIYRGVFSLIHFSFANRLVKAKKIYFTKMLQQLASSDFFFILAKLGIKLLSLTELEKTIESVFYNLVNQAYKWLVGLKIY